MRLWGRPVELTGIEYRALAVLANIAKDQVVDEHGIAFPVAQ